MRICSALLLYLGVVCERRGWEGIWGGWNEYQLIGWRMKIKQLSRQAQLQRQMPSQKRLRKVGSSKTHQTKKVSSPNPPKKAKGKNQSSRKELARTHKKLSVKPFITLRQPSHKNALFHSLQDLPINKLHRHKHHKMSKKSSKNLVAMSKNEDSTASRDFRHFNKNYDHPNGEYFGSRITSLDNKNRSSKSKNSKPKPLKQDKSTHSLKKQIREYRRLNSQHKSESQSLKSQVSDQQLRRLKKMQSIQKMMVMEDIVELEQKRLQLKKIKSDFRS